MPRAVDLGVDGGMTPQPGDVLAFWRTPLGPTGVWREAKHRRTLGKGWAFALLGGLAAVTVSWRIQRATTRKGQPPAPNHVAVYVGPNYHGRPHIVEAEYDRGVTTGILQYRYPADRYRWEVCPFPGEDRSGVVHRAGAIDRQVAGYDFWTVLLMRAATMVMGPGATSRIRSPRNDGKWICSELCADCWEHGGVPHARERFVVPGDFLETRARIR